MGRVHCLGATWSLLCLGCAFDPSGSQTTAPPDASDEEMIDAAQQVDGSVALACSDWSPAPQHFDPCQIELPSVGLSVGISGVWVFDTDDATLATPDADSFVIPSEFLLQSNGPPARLISVQFLTVAEGVTLRVVGSMPLVVAAWGDVAVQGEIDASSQRLGAAGAGSNPADCMPVQATQGASGSGGRAGGGGGGGFAGSGGRGGNGHNGGASGGAGGEAVGPPDVVRGGCNGARGGSGGGGRGDGGGAIQLSAMASIAIDGTVLAGGAGGTGAVQNRSGGGGGGSGGYVGLDAPTVTVGLGAVVAANGGGGGEGDDGDNGQSGEDGKPGATPALGGAGFGGGNGGVGGFSIAVDGANGFQDFDGGGGGGGGAGYILVWSPDFVDQGAIVSPDALAQ